MSPAPARPEEFCRFPVAGKFCEMPPVGRCSWCSEAVCELHLRHHLAKRFAEAVE